MSVGSSSRLIGLMLPRANRFRGHVHLESQQACPLTVTSLKTNTQCCEEQSVSARRLRYPKEIDTFHLLNADELTTVPGQAEMQWGNWYALRSYVRASLWIAPVLALLLQQALMRLAIEFESSMPWMPKWPLGASGTLAAMQAIIGLTTSFMIFSFGSMLVAIQIAGGQLTPRVIATTLLRDNVVRLTTGLFVFSLLFSIGTVSRIETDVPGSVAWIASFLGMLSLVAFLYLIDHAARFLRPVSILWHVADVGLQVIDKVFPDPVTEPEFARRNAAQAWETDADCPARRKVFGSRGGGCRPPHFPSSPLRWDHRRRSTGRRLYKYRSAALPSLRWSGVGRR